MTPATQNIKRNLDQLPTWYDNKDAPSLSGDHCYYSEDSTGKQITVNSPYDSVQVKANSKCVMYGAITNCTTFCPECAERVRKTDLTSIKK